jgi:hypothetical protein
MATDKRSGIEYQPPHVADLGTIADLTAGAGNMTNRDNGINDSSGKSA